MRHGPPVAGRRQECPAWMVASIAARTGLLATSETMSGPFLTRHDGSRGGAGDPLQFMWSEVGLLEVQAAVGGLGDDPALLEQGEDDLEAGGADGGDRLQFREGRPGAVRQAFR